ncbi:MAG: DUF2007 domain-containing protein [Anaerolineaceae bacterium]
MMFENTDDLVSVFQTYGELEGEMVRSFLEAQGIPAMVSSESLGRIYGATVGEIGASTIYVNAANEEKALELLQKMQSGEFANEKLAECPAGCEIFGPHSKAINDSELDQRKHVLILCTGNSARSQMAEAAVNNDLWDQWVAFSAGTEPAGYVHPLALKALEEQGIFHQGYSKSVEEFKEQQFDLVITVCDQANETCPIWLGKANRIHIGFTDPSKVEGDDETKLQAFRDTLSLIRSTLVPMLKTAD